MHIILGASGRVGSAVVADLLEKKERVRGIVRNEENAQKLKNTGADSAFADATDLTSLKKAFKNGDTLFAITAETGQEEDVLGETGKILDNYRAAVEESGIKKIVGLSSIGAQFYSGTGNLIMSYMLEHAFTNLPVTQIFIRPAYYFSNWALYLPTVLETGILPTFYPTDMSLPMIAPADVAHFAAEVLVSEDNENKIYEIQGPGAYNSDDVAKAFSTALRMDIKAVQTPREKWGEVLKETGFSKDAIKNFIEMTDATISGKTGEKVSNTIKIQTKTTLQEFINAAVAK